MNNGIIIPKQSVKLSYAFVIRFSSTKKIAVHENYYCNPEIFEIKCKLSFPDLMEALAPPHVGIKCAKIEDVKVVRSRKLDLRQK